MNDIKLIRPKDLCERLSIGSSTLYRWMDEGKFTVPKVKIGPRSVAFRSSDVEAWIQSRTEQAGEKK